MADNVGYTPGTGATVAADDIAGILHQRVKISLGADGTAVDAPGDGTNGMKVDVTRVTGSVQVGDGTNSIAIDTAIGDAEANAGNMLHTAARGMLYNGTTWDRIRGDITNGIDADVTRLPSLVAGTAYVGKVRLTDGTNDITVDTVFNDGESATENHIDVGARIQGYNGSTFDLIRVNTTTFKCVTATTAQTGAAIWTPAAGKAVVITSLQIQSYGTTSGTAIVWFGATADTTYTRGTDAPVFDGEFAPSATNKPGVYVTYPTHLRGTADYVLRLTTTNAQSITVTVWGYEI
jgi:hypothetical protein